MCNQHNNTQKQIQAHLTLNHWQHEAEKEADERMEKDRQGILREVEETRQRLRGLRAKLRRQTKIVKSDDTILNALSREK